MEKDQKVLIGLIIFIILVAIGIGIYLFVTKKDKVADSVRFKNEYEELNEKAHDTLKEDYLKVDIDDDNIFVYKTDEEILDILDKETGLIYFGFAKCPYCRSMVSLLNDIAKENNLEKIYYVDILNIRDSYEIMEKTVSKITSGTNSYYKILDKLSDYLTDYYITDSEEIEYNTGVKRLYAPTVVAVKDGKIVGFHEGTLDDAAYNKELSEDQKEELTTIFTNMIKEIASEDCTKESC